MHGYPVFLAETFVDVSRYLLPRSNWRSLGLTRGFAREPGGSARWRHHGQPSKGRVLDYGMRWGIEPMFSDFKSRGFSITKTLRQRHRSVDRPAQHGDASPSNASC